MGFRRSQRSLVIRFFCTAAALALASGSKAANKLCYQSKLHARLYKIYTIGQSDC